MQSSWTPSRVNVRSKSCPDIGLSLFFFLVGVEDKFALARFFPFKVVSCDLWWAILISGWGKRKRLESPRSLQGSVCCGQVAKGAAWVPKCSVLLKKVSHVKYSRFVTYNFPTEGFVVIEIQVPAKHQSLHCLSKFSHSSQDGRVV